MHVIVSFKDLYKIVNDFMDICKYVLYACTVQLKDLYKIVNSLTGCWTVMETSSSCTSLAVNWSLYGDTWSHLNSEY